MEAKQWPLPRPFPTGTTLYHWLIVVLWANDADDHVRGVEDPLKTPSSRTTACTASEEKSSGRSYAAVRKDHGHLSDIVEQAMEQREEAAAGGFGVVDVREVEVRPVVLTNNDGALFRSPSRQK